MNGSKTVPHIVVVGGGAGGLVLATRLGKKIGKKRLARITLVDQAETHLWKPLLHEVAAGSIDYTANEVSYKAHAKRNHYMFMQGKLTGVNRTKKKLSIAPLLDTEGEEIIPAREIGYDYLVIAIGSTSNNLGVEGVAEHCKTLDSFYQAKRFHHLFLRQYNLLEQDPNKPLNVVIVGAGATGVELAAELRHAAVELAHYNNQQVPVDRVKITIIEGAPRILPALPERISRAAEHELAKLSVNIVSGESVVKVTQQGVALGNGNLVECDLLIWAAGVKAPEILTSIEGLTVNRLNQLQVMPNLQTKQDSSIFALGDCAECILQEGASPLAPRAQVAYQQAVYLSKAITHMIASQNSEDMVNNYADFCFKDHGSLVSFSRYGAVGQLMGGLLKGSLLLEGILARWSYQMLYRMHQSSLHGYFLTVLYWLSDKLNKVLRPRLKLH
ncbi:NAD(P)/FAD-dependent oxidoreductase [Spartinivicinus poritis]|uniref:NAD(P)/FAD-dependent oxidoreductase n=1 Tax=Spartinivicinus poritis TaxID=2994640 RepID=A0ABT5U9Q6_9GAMM|nr:NAD(P)/FAD-dependent oxidoreductase [Spartinivicinus sp. A2-2]MDE1461879.1 NAD(P)/FAD-dependent oxidoreductase [Spartinivicinus sp. A2-2]